MTGQVMPLVVMGVSGSGKSTVGALLARRLGVEFIDGDDLHPQANKDKMSAGKPLDDADRQPWLTAIGQRLAQRDAAGSPPVIACSALKRSYRELIRSHEPRTRFIHLVGSQEVLRGRMDARAHEFMPSSLLASQLDTLEAPDADEHALSIDVSLSPERIVDAVLAQLDLPASPAGN